MYTERYQTIRQAGEKSTAEKQQVELQKRNQRDAVLRYHAEMLPKESPLDKLDQLSMAQTIYLLSVIRVGLAEDLSFIKPWHEFEIPLAPTKDFSADLLINLARAKLLLVHPQYSQLEAFEFDEKDELTGYQPLQVCWHLPTDKSQKVVQTLEQLVSQKERWPEP